MIKDELPSFGGAAISTLPWSRMLEGLACHTLLAEFRMNCDSAEKRGGIELHAANGRPGGDYSAGRSEWPLAAFFMRVWNLTEKDGKVLYSPAAPSTNRVYASYEFTRAVDDYRRAVQVLEDVEDAEKVKVGKEQIV